MTSSGIGSSLFVGLAYTFNYSTAGYLAASDLIDFPPWIALGSDLPTACFLGAVAGEGITGFFSIGFLAGPGLFKPGAETL